MIFADIWYGLCAWVGEAVWCGVSMLDGTKSRSLKSLQLGKLGGLLRERCAVIEVVRSVLFLNWGVADFWFRESQLLKLSGICDITSE